VYFYPILVDVGVIYGENVSTCYLVITLVDSMGKDLMNEDTNIEMTDVTGRCDQIHSVYKTNLQRLYSSSNSPTHASLTGLIRERPLELTYKGNK